MEKIYLKNHAIFSKTSKITFQKRKRFDHIINSNLTTLANNQFLAEVALTQIGQNFNTLKEGAFQYFHVLGLRIIFHFPRNHKKTKGFLITLGGIDVI